MTLTMHKYFFEHSACGLLICKNDQFSTILEANDAFYRLIGYTKDEMRSLFYNRFSLLVVDDINTMLQKVRASIQGNQVIDYEFRIRNKQGEIMWIHDTATYDSYQNIFYVVLMDVSYRAQELDAIRYEASIDQITQLLNRQAFEQEISAIRMHQKQKQALLLIDLDNFKAVNDTYGHQRGDTVLKEVGRRLQRFQREGMFIGRLGGDEFVIYFQSEDALAEISYIMHQVQIELIIQVNEVLVSCSCGVAYDCHSIADFAQLYTLADKALYNVKEGGKNHYKMMCFAKKHVLQTKGDNYGKNSWICNCI